MSVRVVALLYGRRQRLANEGGFPIVDNALRIDAIGEQGDDDRDARFRLQMKVMKPLNEPPDAVKLLASFLPFVGQFAHADSASG